jgi:hypothetical protein
MSKPIVLVMAAAGLAGCVDDEVTYATTEELLKGNGGAFIPNHIPVPNEHGWATTTSTRGRIELRNEFFQDLGVNGRRCVSCHLPTASWGTNVDQIQYIFDKTDGGAKDDRLGLGAMFRLNDGANSPLADVTTLAKRRAAYSMLLTKGLIRVGIGIPAGAEFSLVSVDDPYHYASAAELSLFRRPLPTTNLKFLSAVMWDGRETFKDENGQFKSIHFDLTVQANDATQGHAEATVPLTTAQRESIVAFELALHSGQVHDYAAGRLDRNGARGGTQGIIDQVFYIGINDNFGDPVTGEPFTPIVFDIYDAWANSTNKTRASIARGQRIFNTREFTIAGVGGANALPGDPGLGLPPFSGTCTTCHDTPNGGNHSVVAPLDIGLIDESERTPDLPLYVLRCNAPGELYGKEYRVTDPGRGLISGKCKDIGKFKGPILRGLSGRAPYFHNGSAETLEDAVDFYDRRFDIKLTRQDKADLVAFLAAL